MSEEKLGVGDELAKLIPDWAVQFKGKCKCKDMQEKMNLWGPDGCEEHRDFIVTHLLAQEEHLVPILKAVPTAFKKVGATRMVNLAIRNARKNS